jgi:hypothetical protein
MIWKCFVAE